MNYVYVGYGRAELRVMSISEHQKDLTGLPCRGLPKEFRTHARSEGRDLDSKVEI